MSSNPTSLETKAQTLADSKTFLRVLADNNLGRSGEGRNPYWLSAGIEAGGEILWSAPEIILYDRYHSIPEAGGEGSDSRLGL